MTDDDSGLDSYSEPADRPESADRSESADADGSVASVSPRSIHRRLRRGDPISLLDVRDRDAFETWRVEGPGVTAAQVPAVEFVQADVRDVVAERFAETGLDEPVIVACGRGEASARVAELLDAAGVAAANLAGGMDAWGELTVATELDVAADGATVVQVVRPSSGCVSHLALDGDEAAVIDPLRAVADEYVAAARDRGARVVAAVDTHVHADHVSGVRAVADAAAARRVLPVGAEERGLAYSAETVTDGDVLRVGDAELRAIHAPGHTSELVVVRLGNLLFSADCVFLDGVGRPDLEAGAAGTADAEDVEDAADARDLARELYHTLHDRLASLPDDVVVAPGHVGPDTVADDRGAYVASLGTLREELGAFDADEAAFVERVLADAPPRPANYERIVRVNLGREDIDEETAVELELGPNNCAVSATR